MVPGLRLNYPETVRPPLEIFGLSPGAKVAVGMYMMVLQNSVLFVGDTVFNIFPPPPPPRAWPRTRPPALDVGGEARPPPPPAPPRRQRVYGFPRPSRRSRR